MAQPPPLMNDLCIVGHVTVDRIEIVGRSPQLRPGGTAYYAGVAAHHLGLEVAVVTRGHPRDRAFVERAFEGVDLRWHDAPATTRFVNAYPSPSLDERTQRVEAVAAPFVPEELDVEARAYLLGPLLQGDLPPACTRRLAGHGRLLALDVQGLLRAVRTEAVVPAPYPDLPAVLADVDVLKASLEEALFATGAATAEAAARQLAAMGPAEVLVTDGSNGSLVLAEGRLHDVPAYRPPRLADATGCGDTYLAAYLACRLAGEPAHEAGHFAAAVAAAKIAQRGAYLGSSLEGLEPVDPAALAASPSVQPEAAGDLR